MSLLELFIIAVGLSADAFAVSVCKGLATHDLKLKHLLLAGAYFGGFQALMPLLGFFLGSSFAGFIDKYDHFVVFILLGFIGGHMVFEAFHEEGEVNASFDVGTMLLLAIATSIDALAVGVSFAFMSVAIVPAISLIGVTTFVLSAIGIKVGHLFGSKYQTPAEVVGGLALIAIGIKVLIQGLIG